MRDHTAVKAIPPRNLSGDRSSDTITVQMDFQPHSELFDMINTGIELDLILADDNEAETRLETIHGKIDRDREEIKENKQGQRNHNVVPWKKMEEKGSLVKKE